MVDGKRREILVTAKTFMKGCVSERVLRETVSSVFKAKFFSNQDNRVIINEEPDQYVFYQENRFRILQVWRENVKRKRIQVGITSC